MSWFRLGAGALGTPNEALKLAGSRESESYGSCFLILKSRLQLEPSETKRQS